MSANWAHIRVTRLFAAITPLAHIIVSEFRTAELVIQSTQRLICAKISMNVSSISTTAVRVFSVGTSTARSNVIG